MHVVYIHAFQQNAHTHKINLEKESIVSEPVGSIRRTVSGW